MSASCLPPTDRWILWLSANTQTLAAGKLIVVPGKKRGNPRTRRSVRTGEKSSFLPSLGPPNSPPGLDHGLRVKGLGAGEVCVCSMFLNEMKEEIVCLSRLTVETISHRVIV